MTLEDAALLAFFAETILITVAVAIYEVRKFWKNKEYRNEQF